MNIQPASQQKGYLEIMEARKRLLFKGDNAGAEKLLDQASSLQKAGAVTLEELQAAAYL